MLAQTVKDTIQGAYRQMISAKKLTPRYGQRLMIAEIARLSAVCRFIPGLLPLLLSRQEREQAKRWPTR